MGACIVKNQLNINELCERRLQFEVDRSKYNKKCIMVWKISDQNCQVLKWPYKFHSTCSYIIMIVGATSSPSQILQRDRTNIELAQMLFGAQFLLLHLKIEKKVMLNQRQYVISYYTFYGDSVEDELMARSCLAHYVSKIQRYLQFGAGFLCLSTLNEAQPIVLRDDLKQFVDFDSEQYEQSKTHIFFKQQLFHCRPTLKQKLSNLNQSLFYKQFITGLSNVPFIEIKEQENQKFKKQKQKKNKQIQQQMPFACEITQINIKDTKKVNKVQTVNVDDSNMLFDDFGIQNQIVEIQKMEEFVKGLFLATEKIAKNFNMLNNKQVRLIVNCSAATCKNWFINDINYKWLDMPEIAQSKPIQYNIQCLIYQVAELAAKCLSQQTGVVIHCSGYHPKVEYSGCRSAAILIGFIMSSLEMSYEDSFQLVNKKWKIKLPTFMQKQLQSLHKRKSQKPKGFRIYSICSYSKNFPSHLVAKYICQVDNLNALQGIDNFSKNLYLCVSVSSAKIMVGKQCQLRDEYQKYAKDYLKLLIKYEGYKLNGQCGTQFIDKTFRKQPKIEIGQQILNIVSKNDNKNPGFIRNEEVVLKYPILRPVWEKKKQDAFYITIRQKEKGAEVIMNKGMNWIGYSEDKQQFLDKIINCYLSHVPHSSIFVTESESDQSLFDESSFKV